jgi:hypothetical protein
MSETYLAGLQVFYDGEVYGERAFLALHAAAKSPRDAHHFAALLQLETETKARLRPLMLRHGLSLAERHDEAAVAHRVTAYRAQTWAEYVAFMAERLAPFVERYQAIAASGPKEDQPILRAVVEHEEALLAWARAECAGASEASLKPILSRLCFPPSPA